MAILQKRLVSAIRALNVRMPHATGVLPRCSPFRSLHRHLGARYLYLLDIQNAYLTIDPERLAEVICEVDPELESRTIEVLEFLRRYSLDENGGLIMGAGASPDLYNLYASQLLDIPLGQQCNVYGLTMTRYLDDIVISSYSQPIGKRKRQRIREVIAEARFIIQPNKTRVIDLAKGPTVVNGIGLKFGGETFLPRHYTRKILGMIHLAMRGEIDPALVHGRMGVLFAAKPSLKRSFRITDAFAPPPTRLEKKLLERYRKLQKLLGIVRSAERTERR